MLIAWALIAVAAIAGAIVLGVIDGWGEGDGDD